MKIQKPAWNWLRITDDQSVVLMESVTGGLLAPRLVVVAHLKLSNLVSAKLEKSRRRNPNCSTLQNNGKPK